MLRIALTGGIGAGKSAVSRLLAQHGAVIVDSDLIAREVVEPGTPGLAAVVERFGADLLTAEGTLDRAALAAKVFGDPEELAALNGILHPLIMQRSKDKVAALDEDAVVIFDVPLLAETGRTGGYDSIVVVETPMELRLERLQRDRSMSSDDANARIARQATDDQRRAFADHIVYNDGSTEDLSDRVDALWAELVPGT